MKKCLQTCASLCTCIKYNQAFAFHSYILRYPIILLVDSEGPDQIARLTDAQADLSLCCLHVPKDRFSQGMVHMTLSSAVCELQMPVTLYSLICAVYIFLNPCHAE